MDKYKIINWNIANSSIKRLKKQLEYINKFNADIIVLTESGNREKNEVLKSIFNKFGYTTYYNDNYIDKYSTTIVVKSDIFVSDTINFNCELSSRTTVIDFKVDNNPITLIGTYFPANNRKKIKKKMKHTEDLLRLLKKINGNKIMLLGDFNSVKRTHVPKFKWFRKWEYELFDKLEENNLVDINAEYNKKDKVYSWFGNKNIGHLYDYAYFTKNLMKKVDKVYFSNETIDKKLSDHAIQFIEMSL